VAAFGLSIRAAGGFPRWLPGLSFVTAALLAINISAIWVGIPDVATLPSALLLSIWSWPPASALPASRRRCRRPWPGRSPRWCDQVVCSRLTNRETPGVCVQGYGLKIDRTEDTGKASLVTWATTWIGSRAA
jgi:hypothetical protein